MHAAIEARQDRAALVVFLGPCDARAGLLDAIRIASDILALARLAGLLRIQQIEIFRVALGVLPPVLRSVNEAGFLWKTVVVFGFFTGTSSPVCSSFLVQGITVTMRTPCWPFFTTRPRAFHALKVKTFSRGFTSSGSMPIAAKPSKMA